MEGLVASRSRCTCHCVLFGTLLCETAVESSCAARGAYCSTLHPAQRSGFSHVSRVYEHTLSRSSVLGTACTAGQVSTRSPQNRTRVACSPSPPLRECCTRTVSDMACVILATVLISVPYRRFKGVHRSGECAEMLMHSAPVATCTSGETNVRGHVRIVLSCMLANGPMTDHGSVIVWLARLVVNIMTLQHAYSNDDCEACSDAQTTHAATMSPIHSLASVFL